MTGQMKLLSPTMMLITLGGILAICATAKVIEEQKTEKSLLEVVKSLDTADISTWNECILATEAINDSSIKRNKRAVESAHVKEAVATAKAGTAITC